VGVPQAGAFEAPDRRLEAGRQEQVDRVGVEVRVAAAHPWARAPGRVLDGLEGLRVPVASVQEPGLQVEGVDLDPPVPDPDRGGDEL
jgi:hypothetical protein